MVVFVGIKGAFVGVMNDPFNRQEGVHYWLSPQAGEACSPDKR
jgi:hypothetical protein